MQEQFKTGDVVILKSDIGKENPAKLTVTNIYDDDEVVCMWSTKNGEIKERAILSIALAYPNENNYSINLSVPQEVIDEINMRE